MIWTIFGFIVGPSWGDKLWLDELWNCQTLALNEVFSERWDFVIMQPGVLGPEIVVLKL